MAKRWAAFRRIVQDLRKLDRQTRSAHLGYLVHWRVKFIIHEIRRLWEVHSMAMSQLNMDLQKQAEGEVENENYERDNDVMETDLDEASSLQGAA